LAPRLAPLHLVSNANVRTAGTLIPDAIASPAKDLAWLNQTASATGDGSRPLADNGPQSSGPTDL